MPLVVGTRSVQCRSLPCQRQTKHFRG